MFCFFILSNHCIISDLSNFAKKKKNATIVIRVLCKQSREQCDPVSRAAGRRVNVTAAWEVKGEAGKVLHEPPVITPCQWWCRGLGMLLTSCFFARPGTTCDHSARTVSKQERVCARLPQIKRPTERNGGNWGFTGGLFLWILFFLRNTGNTGKDAVWESCFKSEGCKRFCSKQKKKLALRAMKSLPGLKIALFLFNGPFQEWSLTVEWDLHPHKITTSPGLEIL